MTKQSYQWICLMVVLLLALVPGSGVVGRALASSSYVVNDPATPGDCAQAAGYTTIQSALDAVAAAGGSGTVWVCPGTYPENLFIDGFNVVGLMGIGSPVIHPSGGTDTLYALDSKQVTVQGFALDGDGSQSGIFFENTSGAIKGNSITNIAFVGIGIVDDDGTASKVKIDQNTVSGYHADEMGVWIDGDVEADISDNQITGPGTGVFRSRGIALDGTGPSTLNHNSIAANEVGVVIRDSDRITVSNNTISGVLTGVSIESRCSLIGDSASNNRVVRNTISGVTRTGILVQALAIDGQSTCNPATNNNRFAGNNLTGDPSAETTGIAIQALDFSSAFNPSADGNKIIQNSLSGFDTGISLVGAANTHTTGNTCDGVSCP